MKYTYDHFISEFEESQKTIQDLFDDMQDDILFKSPSPDKWCPAEILSHLVQTGNQYMTQVEPLFEGELDRHPNAGGPFEPNFAMRWFIRKVSPANQRPLPTVSQFEPASKAGLNKQNLIKEFQMLQQKVVKQVKISKVNQLDLDGMKIKNPVVKIIPMSLTAAYGLMEAHQKRHFGQIRSFKA